MCDAVPYYSKEIDKKNLSQVLQRSSLPRYSVSVES